MRIEIEIDEKAIPDGYEALRFGIPKKGEFYFRDDAVFECSSDGMNARLILRKRFEWPDCIKPGTWAAKDSSGFWFLYGEKPRVTSCGFAHQNVLAEGDCFQIDWPDVDWRDSAMQKPMEGSE